MGRVNVYLPPELHRLVKAAGIPVSQVCQQALRRELRDRERERTARQTVLWDHNTPDGRP